MTDKPVVLIVDDVVSNLQLLAALLNDDYRVKVANSGEQGLKLAQSEPVPDLILLDIIMPELDGFEVCHQLKDQASTRDIPVIFLTGMTDSEDEERGLTLGAVDYINKPIRPAIVEARVKTHITLKKQQDMLHHIAMHDQLTGLYNRRYLLDAAEKKIARASRHRYSLSLFMLDIDKFKAINDRFGHNVGDNVLQSISAVLNDGIRTEDVAARVGGEEFVVLLDNCDLVGAEDKAEKMRQSIEQFRPEGLIVTASFGVAQMLDGGEDFTALLSRADKALYHSKDTGRNRVSIEAAE